MDEVAWYPPWPTCQSSSDVVPLALLLVLSYGRTMVGANALQGDERERLCKSTMELRVNHTLCHCIGITEMPISVGDYHRRATASQVHSCAGVEVAEARIGAESGGHSR